MQKRALFSVILALLVGLPPVVLNAGSAAAAVPGGFTDALVRSVDQPTSLAFTPDGRMLITTKPGQLRVHEQGMPTTQVLDLSAKTCSNSERGLLGVAVDPNFETNHYVYLYYTFNKHNVCPDPPEPANAKNPVNRVSRFVMSGNTIAPSSERVLITNVPSPNGNHNGGDLHFGKDGYLYVSVGDGGCDYAQPQNCQTKNDAARDTNILLGKILRITRNGRVPSDNPYTNPDNSARCNATGRTEPGNRCQETFAWGLRNPFRLAFDPDAAGTSFRINDVGAATWEEIDRGQKGADYGWNCREGTRVNSTTGKCDPAPKGMVGPIHQYNHSNTGCRSITGAAFVPDSASWPASYDNAYLFADFICGKIFKLTPKSGGGFTRTEFATDLLRPVAMTFGPHGSNGEALYYTTFANGGEIRRIAYTG